jgi:hypothetical protein
MTCSALEALLLQLFLQPPEAQTPRSAAVVPVCTSRSAGNDHPTTQQDGKKVKLQEILHLET